MEKTLRELANLVGGELIGDGEVVITGVASLEGAREGDISFLDNPKYASLLGSTEATAIILASRPEGFEKPMIRVDNPTLAFARVVGAFFPLSPPQHAGVHSSSFLGDGVALGQNVTVMWGCYIGDGTEIGDNSVIYPLAFIGEEVKIGREALIYPRVTIRERCIIGDRVIIHSGAVLGNDSFGFARDGHIYRKIPQVGILVIEDDVEIGANCTINRGSLEATRIKRGVKLDDMVHVGHNVIIGEDTVIAAQSAIAGSVIVGDRVIMGGQTGIADHVRIGDEAILGGRAGVIGDVPAGAFYSGFPARPHQETMRVAAGARKMPELWAKFRAIEKRLNAQENNNQGSEGDCCG